MQERTVDPDRRWALDEKYKDEDVYRAEFTRRHRSPDLYIPLDDYLKFIPPPYHGIDGVRVDDYVVTRPSPPPPVPVKEPIPEADKLYNQHYLCECGKEVKSKLGFSAHRRACQKKRS